MHARKRCELFTKSDKNRQKREGRNGVVDVKFLAHTPVEPIQGPSKPPRKLESPALPMLFGKGSLVIRNRYLAFIT
jgi:hypothetical protein